MQVQDITGELKAMSQPSQPSQTQICFRCSQASADVLNELARQRGGLRGLILGWLAQAGYAEVVQHDLARPDGRRRRHMLAEPSQELAAGR
jgi:hypothetical protein